MKRILLVAALWAPLAPAQVPHQPALPHFSRPPMPGGASPAMTAPRPAHEPQPSSAPRYVFPAPRVLSEISSLPRLAAPLPVQTPAGAPLVDVPPIPPVPPGAPSWRLPDRWGFAPLQIAQP